MPLYDKESIEPLIKFGGFELILDATIPKDLNVFPCPFPISREINNRKKLHPQADRISGSAL